MQRRSAYDHLGVPGVRGRLESPGFRHAEVRIQPLALTRAEDGGRREEASCLLGRCRLGGTPHDHFLCCGRQCGQHPAKAGMSLLGREYTGRSTTLSQAAGRALADQLTPPSGPCPHPWEG